MTEGPAQNTTTIGEQVLPANAQVETHLDNTQVTTFESPKTAESHCNLILQEIQSVGERTRAAMETGYAEAQAAKIDLQAYVMRMQGLYNDAKKDIDGIIAQLVNIKLVIEDPANTLPPGQKTVIVGVIQKGLDQAVQSKEVIVHELEQQRARRPFDEKIEKALGKTRQAFAVEAAAGTLPVVDRDADSIEATVKAEVADINANKTPEDLKTDSRDRAEQYEGVELRARAIGLTKLLEERLATVDATLEAQSALNQGSFTVEQLRKGYAYLESKKLLPADWRDPAKSGLAARFLGNLDSRALVGLFLTIGAVGIASVVGAGIGGAVATSLMLTRSVVSGVMGYFAGEKLGRAYGERNAKKEAGTVTVPESLDKATVSDERLVDLIARMEYRALISGKSLRATAAERGAQATPAAAGGSDALLAGLRQPRPTQTETISTTNEAIIDPEYMRLIAELQRRSEMDRESARSYEVSLETKIRQTNARLRELLQDRESVERSAMIGGVMSAAVSVLLPSIIRGGFEAVGWAGGADGSFAHGAVAGVAGKDFADWTTGTGVHSPDALAAVANHGVGTPGTGTAEAAAKTTVPNPLQTPNSPQTRAALASWLDKQGMGGAGVSPEAATHNAAPVGAGVGGPELRSNIPGAPGIPTPEPGSFVPAQADFGKYVIGKIDINDAGVTPDQVNNGFSYIFKRQLMDHAQDYGWDGKGDKEKWAMKKLMSLMKEVKINGNSVYDAQQLWATDDAVGKAYILEMDKNGHFSVDVYQKSGTNWVSYDGHGADTQVMPLENAQGSGSGSGAGHQLNGSQSLNQGPSAPSAPSTFDDNGNSLTGGPSASGPMSGNLAPNAHTKMQWYDQAGFKSEGSYKDRIFGQIYTKAGAQETWSFGAADPSSDISAQLRVNHTLVLDKAGSTGLKFSDSFGSIKDFTGSVPNPIKEQLFNPNHPAFTGRFGRLADEYAQLRQAEYVLGKANSLNPSVISANDVAAMKKAIARELAERVKKLVEFEGVLKEDIRPARIFGKN